MRALFAGSGCQAVIKRRPRRARTGFGIFGSGCTMYLVAPTRTLETPAGCDKTRYDTETHWRENGSMGWAGWAGWLVLLVC